MKTMYVLIGIMLSLSLLMTTSTAQSNDAQMTLFADALLSLQQETGFLHRWEETDVDTFTNLLQAQQLYQSDGIDIQPSSWTTAYHALRYAYEQLWGDSRLWSLQEQYVYAEMEKNCGLRTDIIESFPDESDLPFEDARILAQKQIRDMGDAKNYNGEAIDFDALVESYHFWNYPEYGHVWVFAYYDAEDTTPIYRATLYHNGTQSQIDYYDANEMYNVYTQWYYARGLTSFSHWSIHDQYAFYECLLSLYDRQMNRYGALPQVAKIVLEKKRLPIQVGMIEEAQAIILAKELLKENTVVSDNDINAMVITLSLYENEDGLAVYDVGFGESNQIQYAITIDAYSGKWVK